MSEHKGKPHKEDSIVVAIQTTPNKIVRAGLVRFLFPLIIFIPFIIYGFQLGPFILAYFGSRWLAGQVERIYANEFAYVYLKFAEKYGKR